MNANQINKIQELAIDLLKKHNIVSAPVPVERITKAFGAQVKYSLLDDELSGMAYIKDEIPIIGINALHHPNRQRFTLAHELGHLILHKTKITKEIHVDKKSSVLMRSSSSSASGNKMEVEANRFAAEILMPESFLKKSLKGKSFDLNNDDDIVVNLLAREYKVSVAAMRFRLENLFA